MGEFAKLSRDGTTICALVTQDNHILLPCQDIVVHIQVRYQEMNPGTLHLNGACSRVPVSICTTSLLETTAATDGFVPIVVVHSAPSLPWAPGSSSCAQTAAGSIDASPRQCQWHRLRSHHINHEGRRALKIWCA